MKVENHPKLGKIKGSFANVTFYMHEGIQIMRALPFNVKPSRSRKKFTEMAHKAKKIYHDKGRRVEYEKTCPPEMSTYNYIVKRLMEEMK
jgi:hypothetical protein